MTFNGKNKGILAGAIVLALTLSAVLAPSFSTSKLDDLKGYITSMYKYDVSQEKLDEGTYKGLFGALDKYSVYYTKEEYDNFNTGVTGTFGGIGISLNKDGDYIKIVDVFEGTPAERAGLKTNDVIISVDGESVKGMETDLFVTKTRGQKGTQVTLEIVRIGASKPMKYTMTRDIVTINPIKTKTYGKTAYIKISSFNEHAYSNFKTKIEKFKNDEVEKYVIDLRDNPGGYVSQVLSMAGLFVPKGQELLFEDRKGENDVVHTNPYEPILTGKKIVVLINENSASASEIFAGIMKDYKLATIMGTKSYGKGTVQQIIERSDGSGFKMTIAEYLTPSHVKINTKGISPNVEVKSKLRLDLYNKSTLLAFTEAGEYNRKNEKGLDILAAQERLMVLGYVVKPTGKMDQSTIKALKSFNAKYSTAPGYKLSPKTESELTRQTNLTFQGDGPDNQLDEALARLNR